MLSPLSSACRCLPRATALALLLALLARPRPARAEPSGTDAPAAEPPREGAPARDEAGKDDLPRGQAPDP